jgi:hypothetical protein
MGNRTVFIAWRDLVRKSIHERKITIEKNDLNAKLTSENEVARVALGRLEAAKWEKKMNIYTDEVGCRLFIMIYIYIYIERVDSSTYPSIYQYTSMHIYINIIS